MKVWDRARIELATLGSAVRYASVARSLLAVLFCPLSSISARYRMDVTLKLTSFVNVPDTLNQRYMNMTKDAVSYT